MTTLALITAATAEAHAKHGRSFEDASPELRLTIMMEELGEVARAVMDARANEQALAELPEHGVPTLRDVARDDVRASERHVLHEVAQLGSLCMRWLEVDGAK